MTPWEYLKEVYQDIPKLHRISLMLETIYQSYNFKLYEMIDEYLLSETEDERECRLKQNKEILKGKAKRNKIKLYRGVAENYLLPVNAISFTLDKEVGKSFLKYHSSRHGSRFGFIYEMKIPIDDDGILFYSNEREEQEIFYWAADVSAIVTVSRVFIRGYRSHKQHHHTLVRELLSSLRSFVNASFCIHMLQSIMFNVQNLDCHFYNLL